MSIENDIKNLTAAAESIAASLLAIVSAMSDGDAPTPKAKSKKGRAKKDEPEVVEPAPEPAPEPKADAKAADAKAAPAIDEEDPLLDKPVKSKNRAYSRDDIHKALVSVRDAKGKEAVAAIMARVGAKIFSEVTEDKYAEVMGLCEGKL